MRPSRLIAIARRDLALELSGRRGWVLPLILVGLLLPTTTVRIPMPNQRRDPPVMRVTGEVPDAVRALAVEVVDAPPARLEFREEGGVTIVRGGFLRDDVRQALDGDEPALTLERALRPIRLPGRSLLFALITASTLTGAVSASMAGERAAGTLVGLLAAAVTRWELIAGKWLAWGGFGALASLLAAGSAIALGRVVPGWWLLPLPIVAPATVALGFWLVRRATDVVTGTTVSLRVLPAVLSITGLAAWFLGRVDPLLGASVPLGGALVAAGGTWDGVAAPAVAFASSAALCAACLAHTAYDLEDAPSEPLPGRTLGAAAATTAFGIGAWWLPIAAPILWGAAGNASLTADLPRSAGWMAGGLGLALLALNGSATTPSIATALGLRRFHPSSVLGAAVAAMACALLAPTASAEGDLLAQMGDRLAAALHPTGLGATEVVALLASAIGAELFFRGWIQHRWGPVVATIASVVVTAPTAPLTGLVIAATQSALVHQTGSVGPALLAHLGWIALVVVLPAAPTGVGAAIAVALAGAIVGAAWRRG